MIKFFRHIRQKLLANNHFGKYLLHALGEIILVVLGILIALQINILREQQKDRQKEEIYLSRLAAEGQQNITTFEGYISSLNEGNKSIEQFNKAIRATETNNQELITAANTYFKYGSIYPIFAANQATFEDLSSTGNLTVVRNSLLRDAIVNHYAMHQQVSERIDVSTNWTLPLDAEFTLKYPVLQYEPITSFLFEATDINKMALEIRNNHIDFITNTAAHYWINKDAILRFEELITNTKALIDAINEELKTLEQR